MADGELTSVILQINGDTKSSKAPSNLEDRELYVNKDGYIYYGDSNSNASLIKSGYADEAAHIKGTGFELRSTGDSSLSGMKIGESTLEGNGKTNISNVVLKSVTVENSTFQGSSVTSNKFFVGSQSYGTILPTEGIEEGQIFFLQVGSSS